MKQFRAMNKLKKIALKVIAEYLSEEEIKGLKQMFNTMETDGSGTITYDEFRNGMSKLGSKMSEAEMQHLMEAADVDKSGTIENIKFITATMHQHRLEKEEHFYNAFQHFDKDGSGSIETANSSNGSYGEVPFRSTKRERKGTVEYEVHVQCTSSRKCKQITNHEVDRLLSTNIPQKVKRC